MANRDLCCLQGSNCSLLCYNHTVQSTVKIQRDDRVTTGLECVRVCVFVRGRGVHINPVAVIWKLCTRIHTWGVRGRTERGRAAGISWALHFEAAGGSLGRKARSELNVSLFDFSDRPAVRARD